MHDFGSFYCGESCMTRMGTKKICSLEMFTKYMLWACFIHVRPVLMLVTFRWEHVSAHSTLGMTWALEHATRSRGKTRVSSVRTRGMLFRVIPSHKDTLDVRGHFGRISEIPIVGGGAQKYEIIARMIFVTCFWLTCRRRAWLQIGPCSGTLPLVKSKCLDNLVRLWNESGYCYTDSKHCLWFLCLDVGRVMDISLLYRHY